MVITKEGTLETKSFHEVHEELEKESLFIKNLDVDISDFKKKGDFLKSVGFGNSISGKLYSEVSDKKELIESYNRRYYPNYKFILKPQLERI